MRRKLVWIVLTLFAILYARAFKKLADLQYEYAHELRATTMADFAARKRNFSLKIGVPEFAVEKFVERDATHNGYAILYIHGFGATRAEGEATVDALAKDINANSYYVRLPGHGLSAEPHAAATFDQYLQASEEALAHSHLMGKKVIVIGTSTGALLATYLGMKHPKKIYALVLASPLWDFGNKATRILNFPGGRALGEFVMGKDRDANWKSDPEKRVHPEYSKYWLTRQKFSALVNLNNLRRFVVDPREIRELKVPALGLVYYRDKDHLDSTIDIASVRDYFPRQKKSKIVEIADGSHVLLSGFVRSDKVTILRKIKGWLREL